MNQNNIFSSISRVCRTFYGKNLNFERDEFPYFCVSAAGLLPGLMLAVMGAVFVLLMGRIGGGIIAALMLPLFLEILTGWRGVAVTVSCIERFISGRFFAANHENESAGNAAFMQRQILFASIYLFRMAAFGLLAASGNAVWFVYVLGGAYLIRGELLKENDDILDGSPYSAWIFYIVFSVVSGVLAFHWTALASLPLAFILTALLLIGSRRLIENFFGRTEFWMIDLLGYLSENLMLFAGLILFGRQIYG